MKTYVIAGNYNQAMQWIESQCKKRFTAGDTSVSMSDYVVLDRPEKILGVKDPHGVFIGTWRELDNIVDLVEALFTSCTQRNLTLEKIRKEIRPKSVTIPHGLGAKPTMIIIKNGGSSGWDIYDTNPIPPSGRCVGIMKLPDDFDWKSTGPKETL